MNFPMGHNTFKGLNSHNNLETGKKIIRIKSSVKSINVNISIWNFWAHEAST